MRVDTRIIAGDNMRVFVKVRDNLGLPVNITSALSIKFAVSPAYGQPLSFHKSLGNGVVLAAADEFYYDISQENSQLPEGRYVQEAEIITSSGLRYTIFQGEFRVFPKVIDNIG